MEIRPSETGTTSELWALRRRVATLEAERASLHKQNANLREQAEMVYAQLECVDVGLLFCGPQARIVHCNQAALLLLGLTAAGADGMPRLAELAGAEFQHLIMQVFATGRAAREVLPGAPRAAGEPRGWWHVSAAPLCDGHGAVQSAVVSFCDVTASREKDLHLQRLESLGRLVGGVAHDFNNNLTVMLSASAWLLEDLAHDHPARDEVEQIHAAAERAAALTHQLLVFSRRQPQQAQTLQINTVVGALEKLLRRLIGTPIELHCWLDPAAGPVRIDRVQIEQALLNLAINAAEAMPDGGHLTIETALLALHEPLLASQGRLPAGRYVRISISDTGHGMEDSVRLRAFEPFFTTKASGQGTGLGLALVHEIVTQNGGAIGVSSMPNQGTTFQLFLPAVEPFAGPISPGSARPAPAQGRGTVLLVEDDAAVRAMLAQTLRRLGYSVCEAGTSEQALDLAVTQGWPAQLALIDLVLPGRHDGRWLGQQLTAHNPAMRLVYLTGRGDQAPAPDAAVVLLKPLALDELAKAVAAYMPVSPTT